MTFIHKIKPINFAALMLCFALGLIGCARELPTQHQDETRNANFIINLNRAGQTDIDNRIESLRLIIFNEDNKSMIKNIVFTPSDVYEPITQKYVLSLNLKGFRAVRYFVIANEPAQWNLNRTISYADLKALEVNYYNSASDVSDVSSPFLMLAQCDQAVEVPSGSSVINELTLVRNVVKVTLKLKQVLALPSTELLALSKVSIEQVPKTGFLFPAQSYNPSRTYTKTTTIDLEASDFEISADYSKLKTDLILYIPEHLLTDKDNYTFIRILGTEIGSGKDVHYEIVLGDGADKLYRKTNPVKFADLTTSDLSITRNTHLIVDATITPKMLLVTIGIIPWNDGGTIDVEGGGMYYLNLSDAYVVYPHMLYFDKDKKAWIKDANGAYVAPSALDYYCYFWTNRASSTVETTGFELDQDPTEAHNITNNMIILRDSPSGESHDVMGRVDVHIPAEDVMKGFLKSYSMRLKNDKIDRKLTFAVPNYDLIAEVIAPAFTKITDLVITGHGTSSATCTKETFEIEALLPKGTALFAIASGNNIKCTCERISSVGTDIGSPIKHKVTYTINSPRYATLGDQTVKFQMRRDNYTVVYDSPFTLSVTVKKK